MTPPGDERKPPPDPKRIGVCTICNVRTPIYRASVVQVSQLDGCDGWFDHVNTIIWIREGQSETQERDTIVHEKVHAFLYLSGLAATLKLLLGPKRAKHWDGDNGIEEALVRQATPHLVPLWRGK